MNGNKRCIILGNQSEIAKHLKPMLEADGWTVVGWGRHSHRQPFVKKGWDLALVTIGQVAPVGLWHQQNDDEWESAIRSNVLLPVRLLRSIWQHRRLDAAVCFFAGANPNQPMVNYSAYSVGKMALLKACEHLDLESPDCKFFALAPGTILTKIHNATVKARVKNDVLMRALMDPNKEPEIACARVYECLKWCLSQPKEVIGGRNICVSDPWDSEALVQAIAWNNDLYKLRRYEDFYEGL